MHRACCKGRVTLRGCCCSCGCCWHGSQVLLALVLPTVQPASLLVANWDEVPRTLPVIALSFVYQNV